MSAPIVVSVHDVSFLEHPEYFTSFRAMQLRFTVRRTVKAASCVLTPSEFSKRRILDAYKLPDDKVVVLPNGVSSYFTRWLAKRLSAVCARSLPAVPFILTVGDLQPRKNHLGLIHAFEDLIARASAVAASLGGGRQGDLVRANDARGGARSRRWRIAFTSPVSWTTKSCGACMAPAICSFIHRSMKVSDCRFWKPWPADARWPAPILPPCRRWPIPQRFSSILPPSADLVFAMRDLLLNPELRQRMERLGVQRAAMFSWTSSAAKTLDLYYAVAGRRSQRLRGSPKVQFRCSPMSVRCR